MSGTSSIRRLLLLLLAALLGGFGFLVYRQLDPNPLVLAGEAAFNAGKSLEKQNDFAAAAKKYDEAIILLENAEKRLTAKPVGAAGHRPL